MMPFGIFGAEPCSQYLRTNQSGRRSWRQARSLLLNVRAAFLFDEDYAGRAGVRGAKKIDEQAALGLGMKEKAEEFVASGGKIYQKAINR
jgi:hypothetical protein